ncbi:EAL and HDOD domain-containing protein [Aquipuribacter nitratireducens]|uniref:EAL and HDOD domain-containing protein n=1 Tax=Aquipuribacter nitratireducens TaxID=650104 RepID=A0ABW0GNF6_9MICO
MSTSSLHTVLVGRQGIHELVGGIAGGLVGYELLFRQLPIESLQDEQDHEAATAQVLSAVFGDFGVDDISGRLPLYVNAPRGYVVGDVPLPDVPDRVVVEVLEHVGVDAEVLEGVERLRAQGYRVAIDDWDGDARREPLLRVADVVKIDLSRLGQAALHQVVEQARAVAPHAQVLVERVETELDLELAAAAGADLVQGFFLDRPRTVATSTLTPSEVACVRLLAALAAEAEASEVEALVSSDPGLALRVLRTASSPAGVGRPVRSVLQAVVLLGPRILSAWVVLMVLGGSRKVPREHVVTMLARAGACGRLEPEHRDVAYTAGLLSAVSEVLGSDPAETLRSSGVDEAVQAAVLHGEGPVGSALRAVVGHERGAPAVVMSNGYTPFEVSMAYLAALREAARTASAVDG